MNDRYYVGPGKTDNLDTKLSCTTVYGSQSAGSTDSSLANHDECGAQMTNTLFIKHQYLVISFEFNP